MADRTDREEKGKRQSAENLLLPALDNLQHRKSATEEVGRREFVAVGHGLALHGGSGSGVVEEESIGRAERTYHQRLSLEEAVGGMDRLVAVVQHLRSVGMGKAAMVEPRMPEALMENQMVLGERFVAPCLL